MRRRDALIGLALGAVAGLITSPIIQIAVRALFTEPRVLWVFVGALIATLFFAISAITVAIFQTSTNLMPAMLIVYGTKTALLLAVFGSLRLSDADELAMFVSMLISGPAYLIFQTLYIAKWRRKYRNFASA